MNKTHELYNKAKSIIPGGTQLLSKRPEMHAPEQWPAYYSKAHGCECYDLDGNHFYDFSFSGINSCLLGFNDNDVNTAIINAVKKGAMCTLNAPEEVELAEELIKIHPWGSKVRFTRCGGESMTVAVRIARAATGNSKLAVCGYHGWHDWYLAANLGTEDSLSGHLLPGLKPAGVPNELEGTCMTFRNNDVKAFDQIISEHSNSMAAIIMEPCRYNLPKDGFLEHIRSVTKQKGIPLIFDEITIGWRYAYGGSHLKLGVIPDIAVFAKALGNGTPIGAIIGNDSIMDAVQKSFISSTYWTERIGFSAALATLRKMKETNVVNHVEKVGKKLLAIWESQARDCGINITTNNCIPCSSKFDFAYEDNIIIKTLFTQYMLEEGFLASTAASPTLAHNDSNLEKYEEAINKSFNKLAKAIDSKNPKQFLKGPCSHRGFKRLN
jgi:glutamate-1-semialdehyde aminotransferase